MKPLHPRFCHFGSHGVATIAHQAVNAGAYQKMRSKVLGQAEQLIDVAFQITNMNAAIRVVQPLDGLAKAVQPANAFLFSIGARVGLIRCLSAAVPLNLARVQTFVADKPGDRPPTVTAKPMCMRIPHSE